MGTPVELSAVTIDLWHTLIYLPPDAEEAYMDHQLEIGTRVLRNARPMSPSRRRSEEQLRAAFERSYTSAVHASVRGHSITPREQIARAGRSTGRSVDPEQYLEGLRAEVRTTPFRRAPGAISLLRELRSHGYRVAVISNTVGEPGAYLRPILSAMGFDEFVEQYVFSDEHPWTKPSPRIFRYALGLLGDRAGSAVHVGDGWSDVEGARRARYRGSILFTGLHAYGARYRKLFLSGSPELPAATYRVRRLSEVGPLVRRLLPRV